MKFELFFRRFYSWITFKKRSLGNILLLSSQSIFFHQHFMSSFFIQKCFAHFVFVIFWRKESSKKAACKMLVKLIFPFKFYKTSYTMNFEKEGIIKSNLCTSLIIMTISLVKLVVGLQANLLIFTLL